MAYSQSLAAMRHFLTIPWQDSTKPVPVTPEESRAFTLHSLKVCLLAAGAQVRATEEPSTPRPPQKPKRTALQPRRYDPSPGPPETNMPSLCTGMAAGTAHSQGGQPPTLEPPFHVDRSQPKPAYQVSSFGEGVSRFVYSREADLESFAIPEVPEFAQEPQPSHQPGPTAAQIPEDDTEALLVENSSQRSAYFVTARGE